MKIDQAFLLIRHLSHLRTRVGSRLALTSRDREEAGCLEKRVNQRPASSRSRLVKPFHARSKVVAPKQRNITLIMLGTERAIVTLREADNASRVLTNAINCLNHIGKRGLAGHAVMRKTAAPFSVIQQASANHVAKNLGNEHTRQSRPFTHFVKTDVSIWADQDKPVDRADHTGT